MHDSGFDPIFGSASALPRGPHKLSRDEVHASQRQRLLAALVDVVGERGYQRASISEIGRRAGVSPRTFYEHFGDKLAGLLAAYDVFSLALTRRMTEGLRPNLAFDEVVHRTLRAYLLTLDENPRAARTFLFEMHGAGSAARVRRREATVALATGLRAFFEREHVARDADVLPESAYLAMVYGIREVICDRIDLCERIDRRHARPLVDFTDELAQFVLAAARGAAH